MNLPLHTEAQRVQAHVLPLPGPSVAHILIYKALMLLAEHAG